MLSRLLVLRVLNPVGNSGVLVLNICQTPCALAIRVCIYEITRRRRQLVAPPPYRRML